jgi:hypothetical protein
MENTLDDSFTDRMCSISKCANKNCKTCDTCFPITRNYFKSNLTKCFIPRHVKILLIIGLKLITEFNNCFINTLTPPYHFILSMRVRIIKKIYHHSNSPTFSYLHLSVDNENSGSGNWALHFQVGSMTILEEYR